MTRARCVRVCQFIDDRETGMPGEDRIEIHLLELCSAIFDLRSRHDRHSFQQRLGFFASVRLDNANHDLASFSLLLPRGLQHGVGLAHTGRHPKENLEFAATRTASRRASGAREFRPGLAAPRHSWDESTLSRQSIPVGQVRSAGRNLQRHCNRERCAAAQMSSSTTLTVGCQCVRLQSIYKDALQCPQRTRLENKL